MKILLPIDGSANSKMAVSMVKALQLPAGTRVVVLGVVPEHIFLGGLNFHMFMGEAPAKKRAREAQQQRVEELLEEPVERLKTSGLKVKSLARWGNTAEVILEESEKGISLIVMGAKGATDPASFRLGSVALKVLNNAKTGVLLVRKELKAINQVMLATDGSKYADSAARFLLDLPLPEQCKVILISAVQSYTAALLSMPMLDLEADRKLLKDLQKAEENRARDIVAKGKERFREKGYKTISEVFRGGASESILIAADKYDPDIIVLGARGLSGIESFLLGSVTQRISRYARTSVLIWPGSG